MGVSRGLESPKEIEEKNGDTRALNPLDRSVVVLWWERVTPTCLGDDCPLTGVLPHRPYYPPLFTDPNGGKDVP